VATLGTACSLEHLKVLARHAPLLYVLYDGDEAGKKAILRLAEMCWEVNIEPYVVMMPQGEDPASFLAKGRDLKGAINAAKDIFKFYLDTLGEPFSNLSLGEKLRNTQRLLALFKNIDDHLKRDILLQQASQVLNIPLSSLTHELEQLQSKRDKKYPIDPEAAPQNTTLNEQPAQDLSQISLLEKKLFSVILANVKFLEKTDAVYLIQHFSEPLRTILEKVRKQQVTGGEEARFVDFYDSLPMPEQNIINQLMLECNEEDPTKTFDYLITQFQKQHWKSIVQDIKLKISEAEHSQDDQKVKELLTVFQEFKKRLLNRRVL
jgi:DNA primase